MRSFVILKPERFASQEIRAGDGGTPVFFNMFNDQIVTGEVADIRLHFRVVHRIGHIAHQSDVHPLIDHLPDRKWPTEDAHVGVNTHHDHVFNPTAAHQTIGLIRIGDGVAVMDFDGGNLPGPRAIILDWFVAVATPIGIINRKRRFFFRIDAAPAFKRSLCFDLWCCLSSLPLRCILIFTRQG